MCTRIKSENVCIKLQYNNTTLFLSLNGFRHETNVTEVDTMKFNLALVCEIKVTVSGNVLHVGTFVDPKEIHAQLFVNMLIA